MLVVIFWDSDILSNFSFVTSKTVIVSNKYGKYELTHKLPVIQ